jgi:hypothetical protein
MTPPIDENRRKLLLEAFRIPSVQTTVSRKSSITNAFVNMIIPVIAPAPEEIQEALIILAMDPADVRCAYCGNTMTEWDHLRPLVLNRRPTGYITEIANLVPCCAKCNQSKGNTQWRIWIRNEKAKHSPTRRRIPDVADRIARLEAYGKWRTPTLIDFEAILGQEAWAQYWAMWEGVNSELLKCKEVADSHREKITNSLQAK